MTSWLYPNYKGQWSEPDCLARKSLSWYYVGLGGSRTKAWVVVLHSVSWDPHNNNQGWKEDSLRNSLRSLGLASKSPAAAAAAKTSFSCSYLWNGTFQRRGQQQAKSLVNMNFSNYFIQNRVGLIFMSVPDFRFCTNLLAFFNHIKITCLCKVWWDFLKKTHLCILA